MLKKEIFKKKSLFFFLCISALVLATFPTLLFSFDLEKQVVSKTLKNGIKILLQKRSLTPTVSFYVRHRVGAVDEYNYKTGTAHMLEHMLFKGTKTIGTKNFAKEEIILSKINMTGKLLDSETMKGKYADPKIIDLLNKRLEKLSTEHKKWIVENEIDRLYKENGAENLNATTSQDLTTFYVSLPSNKIELWARIESDRMLNPVFREFYSERKVVIEERKQRIESDPRGKLFEQFFATAYILHPYRNPIIGWSSEIPHISVDEVKDFFHNYHRPDNTVIAVVGDINIKDTIEIIDKYFGSIPNRKFRPSLINEEPPQMGERRIEVLFDANPHLVIGYRKPNMPHYDDYVFDVIDAILTKGRSSRLFKSLVIERGIASNVQSYNGMPGQRYTNLFVITVQPRVPHGNSELENAIEEEIEKLKNSNVSEFEINKIKNQLKADFLRGLESNSGLASMLSYYESILGDYRYITNYLSIIDKITPEDVMRVSRMYFTKNNKTVASLIKK